MYSLADAIIEGDIKAVKKLLAYSDINEIDEYGFRPLIEAAIVDNMDIAKLLLQQGADPNQQDVLGGTALQWAVENNNIELSKLLLSHQANPNAYNLAGQPVLVMTILRNQKTLKEILLKAGADLVFAQDYINVKLMGHMYELVGMSGIISPENEFVEVDFEGFYLEVTLGIIAESLQQFQNHFVARQLRRYAVVSNLIVEMMHRAAELIKFQQYRMNVKKHQAEINQLLHHQPLLIPVGYEGHAVTFIVQGDIWVKCDRREDSRLFDNIMFYRVHNKQQLTKEFLQTMMYRKQDSEFINNDIDKILGLEPITEIKVDAQISGNCSWANVEACIPSIFFLVLHQKTQALNYFHRWREWNKDRALDYCIQSFKRSDKIRKACKAEILAAVLFQCSDMRHANDKNRVESILAVLLNSRYEYVIKNYLRVYFYETNTEKGRHFSAMLKGYGFKE